MQIVVANVKGECGKSTLVASLEDLLDADIVALSQKEKLA